MNQTVVSHVAFLVPSVEKAAAYLRSFEFKIGTTDLWEGEGTQEIYVGDTNLEQATLLLMEPVKEGAYTRAMDKRGPGLHHIAIDVLNLESFLEGISNSGWLLHPKSIHTMKEFNTAYLARPGVPTLIEVQEKSELNVRPHFIEHLVIPGLTNKHLTMFADLGLRNISTEKSELILTIQGKPIHFSSLIG